MRGSQVRAALKCSNLSWKFMGCVMWACLGPPGAAGTERDLLPGGRLTSSPLYFLAHPLPRLHPSSVLQRAPGSRPASLALRFQGQDLAGHIQAHPPTLPASPQETHLPTPSLCCIVWWEPSLCSQLAQQVLLFIIVGSYCFFRHQGMSASQQPILLMWKLRLREVWSLVHSHTAPEWQL